MALILKGGGVFLHIPKTGGNWVTTTLQECGLVKWRFGHKHADMDRLFAPVSAKTCKPLASLTLHKTIKALRTKPFMFCFVRHPLKWYESWFKYMTQPARNWKDWGNEKDLFDWHPNAALNGCGAPEFNQFVRNVIEKRPGYVTELFTGYTKTQIDFVGKQETLREDLVAVLKRLDLKFDEEIVMKKEEFGVSPKPKQKVEWDPGLRREVMALERVALMRYGYPLD